MGEVTRYAQTEQAWRFAEDKANDNKMLALGFKVADIHLNRTYLDNFSSAPILKPDLGLSDRNKIRIIEITKLVYDTDENFADKLMSVYSALYSIHSSVALIIDSDGEKIRFFLGVRSERNGSIAGDLLEATFRGNFPGIVYERVDGQEAVELVNEIKKKNIKGLSAVSIVPSHRDSKKDSSGYVQGIEKFIDTMIGRSYTLVCLATPLDRFEIEKKKHGYEELCSSLSPYMKTSMSYGENESKSVNKSLSSTFSKSVNNSVSNSNTNSTTSSRGSNYNEGSGNSYSGNYGVFGVGWGTSNNYSNGTFESYTSGNSFTQAFTESTGTSTSDTNSKGTTDTKGNSKTVTLSYENKGVQGLVKRAEAQLERFKKCESFGMWEFSGYFLSNDINTSMMAGNAYKAIMTGDDSNVESAHLNIWSLNQQESIEKILDYVLNLKHPLAQINAMNNVFSEQLVTPTNLVSGNELPLVMGFPKKSVPGLSVVEMAEFGRAVVEEDSRPKETFDIGNVYHMGVTEKTRVNMDLNLLSSHCFITGSSGSGKSYATYQLLNAVVEKDAKIMIIETAKGEYKRIFGGLKGIKIFTTDSNEYRMLKINPFKFNENIHVLSHIEQLLQIFNASWPLYAAMPAILKDAVVKSYMKCGWDVQNSIWIPGISERKYPVFSDILEILPQIINKSDYSSESKGDYKGSLLTRVQAMTVGVNGQIFKDCNGVEDSILFDSNVIIDLSELGSDEAIALIMGVLIMKLNEYRKAQRKGQNGIELNSKLRHITVLEEAHNILKRTSKEQSQDGANMVGKSVEMISNSIKEMRTYGEGFVIIDQSPMAVDVAAIENTATKIIMNTPARDACEELGSALSLSEIQTRELSRLNVGVAAVYQKGWLSPVLMKIDKWDDRYRVNENTIDAGELRLVKGKLVTNLIEQYKENKFSPMKLKSILRESMITPDKRREFDDIILQYAETYNRQKRHDSDLFGRLLFDVIGCEEIFKILPIDGIPTYNEFNEFDIETDEFRIIYNNLMKGADCWRAKVMEALKLYVYMEENVELDAVMIMLRVIGKKGNAMESPNDRFVMLYRILCNILGRNA